MPFFLPVPGGAAGEDGLVRLVVIPVFVSTTKDTKSTKKT